MADARSLLRAKKATTVPKVDSPHATYTASGELKCVLCAVKGSSKLFKPQSVEAHKLIWFATGPARPFSDAMDGTHLVQAAQGLARP